MQALSNSTGFMNNVQASITQENMDQITQAMTMLAQNIARDHKAVANLVTTNTHVADQLATSNRALDAINQRLNTLDRNGNGNVNGNGNRNGNGNGNRNGNRNGNGNRNVQDCGRNDMSYCHTHGRTHNPGHTSATCNNREEGHKDTATLDNRQEGSNRYCGDNN